jgi:hypothetical protein
MRLHPLEVTYARRTADQHGGIQIAHEVELESMKFDSKIPRYKLRRYLSARSDGREDVGHGAWVLIFSPERGRGVGPDRIGGPFESDPLGDAAAHAMKLECGRLLSHTCLLRLEIVHDDIRCVYDKRRPEESSETERGVRRQRLGV